MCIRCETFVKQEMDVQDTDLPNLPFKPGKWLCAIPGCTHGTGIRDYGLSPYYWHTCKKRINKKTGKWRGGWFDVSEHWFLCFKHWKLIDRVGMDAVVFRYGLDAENGMPEALAKKIVLITKTHKN